MANNFFYLRVLPFFVLTRFMISYTTKLLNSSWVLYNGVILNQIKTIE